MDDENEIGSVEYLTARDRLATDVQIGKVAASPSAMIEHVRKNGDFNHYEATEVVDRFRRDLRRHLAMKLCGPQTGTASE